MLGRIAGALLNAGAFLLGAYLAFTVLHFAAVMRAHEPERGWVEALLLGCVVMIPLCGARAIVWLLGPAIA